MMQANIASSYERPVKSIFDHGIYMLDQQGIVTSWNKGAEDIQGYAAEEIIGQHCSIFYTEADRSAGLPERGLSVARQQGRFSDEGWRLRKNGTRFWASVVIDPIHDASGSLIGFADMTRDMTEARPAQRALAETERNLRLLIEGVTDYAIYMIDSHGCVTHWNAGATRIKGYTAQEILGKSFRLFYTAEDIAGGEPERALTTARQTGHYDAEGWRIRKDRSRFWASVVIDVIHDDDGQFLGYAKITRDISERRETQARLDEAREHLFQSRKIEALGQLTSGVAHDFNNLLTAILGSAELGLMQIEDPVKVRRLFHNILNAGQHGASLIQKLLTFARRQPLQTKIIDLKEKLPQTTDLLRSTLRADIEISLETSDPLWTIDADPGQLELALLNLGCNARDAMPDGGWLRISVSNQVLKGTPDGLSGDFVAITVSDTGTGIAPDNLHRLFDPFFTTKGFGQGTGLGLSQVFGFVKQHKGGVTVKSDPGQGSVFTLFFPANPGSVAEQRFPVQNAVVSPAKIMIVDDEIMIAAIAAAFLSELGYATSVVHSGSSALEAFNRGEKPHLLLSDIIMPGGISGLELAGKIRTRYPELPILLCTGYSNYADSAHGFPVLAKPYNFETLGRTVKTLLDQPSRGAF